MFFYVWSTLIIINYVIILSRPHTIAKIFKTTCSLIIFFFRFFERCNAYWSSSGNCNDRRSIFIFSCGKSRIGTVPSQLFIHCKLASLRNHSAILYFCWELSKTSKSKEVQGFLGPQAALLMMSNICFRCDHVQLCKVRCTYELKDWHSSSPWDWCRVSTTGKSQGKPGKVGENRLTGKVSEKHPNWSKSGKSRGIFSETMLKN